MNFQREVQKSFGTIRQMLEDRGVDTASLTSVAAEDLIAASAGKNVFYLDLPSCKHRIVYNMNPRFKLADVRKLLEEEGPSVFVVVTKDRPTHAALKGVNELAKDIQFFQINELQVNISRHTLVPPHEPIRVEQAIASILTTYRVKTRFQLPLILSSDPMARYLALKHGQLVRITRPSPSAGTYVLYRCCMKSA
jgi:DNA-directed RNA polymerase subunit H (RpoH/RPB5)